jgi:hypothetical protein
MSMVAKETLAHPDDELKIQAFRDLKIGIGVQKEECDQRLFKDSRI